MLFTVQPPSTATAADPVDGYHEFNYGQTKGGDNWVQAIEVTTPSPRAEVRGDVRVEFRAPGMSRAKAMCWQQPTKEDPSMGGHDSQITPHGIALDAAGNGSFVFPAEQFPNGPLNLRIFAQNDQGKHDIFELQLFNLGGVKWNQGIPRADPPAAKGLKLIFEDDFTGPLSISNDGRGARYNAHKPRFGDFSGWQFANVMGEGKPFGQAGTWLKIAARKDDQSPEGRSGLIASVNMDGEGIWAKAPAYLECRFTAQSAPGTWPAFWTLTALDSSVAGDELDIVEAYGGVGKGNPNHGGYSIVSHFWGQKTPDGKPKNSFSATPPIMELGGKSYWSTTFHTYGVLIGLEETVYFFDDIEVLRHPTNDVSRDKPHCFLVNYAIGGISRWPIDLNRYGNGTDMWVDFVRVYAKEPVDYKLPPQKPKSTLAPTENIKAIGLNFSVSMQDTTELTEEEAAGADGCLQASWNNLPGANGESHALNDADGRLVPSASARWSVPQGDTAWRSKIGQSWGFGGENYTLQKGYIQLGGDLSVTGVPFRKYDVYVYLNADSNGGAGSVTISSPAGSVDPVGTYYYKLDGLGGQFVATDAAHLEQVKGSNLVVFRGNTAKEFAVNWKGDISGGWTGVSAVQIVETP